MFTAFEKERNRCGGAAVAANGRIMREGERTRIIRPFANTTVAFFVMPGCKEQSSPFRCSRSFLWRIALSEKSATFRDYAWKHAPLWYSKITLLATV